MAINKRSFKKQTFKKQIIFFIIHNIKMQNINLKLDDLKAIAKNRGIRGYKRMSEERSISSINKSRPVKEKNFDGARIE